MKMLKDQKLQNENYVKNLTVLSITNKEQYDLKKNDVSRYVLVLAITIQIVIQLNDLLKPINGKHQVMVNLVYFAYSFLILISLFYSFKFKESKNLVLMSTALLAFKCNFRIFDFEKTQNVMENKEWNQLVVFNAYTGDVYLILILLFFEA